MSCREEISAIADLPTATRLIEGVDDDVLRGLLSAEDDWLRLLAAEALLVRGSLGEKEIPHLLSDSHRQLRLIGIEWLVSAGKVVSLERLDELLNETSRSRRGLFELLGGGTRTGHTQIREMWLARLPLGELRIRIDWLSPHGPSAQYVLLRDNFETYANECLADMQDGFSRIREGALEAFVNLAGSAGRREAEEQLGKYESFIVESYTLSVLRAFRQHSPGRVLQRARDILAGGSELLRHDLVAVAADIVSQAGSTADLSLLVACIPGAIGSTQDALIGAAINLSTTPSDVGVLLKSGCQPLVLATLGRLDGSTVRTLRPTCEALLSSEDESIREASALVLFMALGRDECEKMLRDYQEAATYFYNVVFLLDRFLYAPDFVQRALVRIPTEIGH
jgi:hypothetical protein